MIAACWAGRRVGGAVGGRHVGGLGLGWIEDSREMMGQKAASDGSLWETELGLRLGGGLAMKGRFGRWAACDGSSWDMWLCGALAAVGGSIGCCGRAMETVCVSLFSRLCIVAFLCVCVCMREKVHNVYHTHAHMKWGRGRCGKRWAREGFGGGADEQGAERGRKVGSLSLHLCVRASVCARPGLK